MCQSGTYRLRRMLSDLTNAPATFQRTLDILLSEFNWRTCLIKLGALIVCFSPSTLIWRILIWYFPCFSKKGFRLNLKKFRLFTDNDKNLGDIIKPGAHATDEARVKSPKQLQHYWNISQMRSFHGFCSLYQRFFSNHTDITALVTKVLRKGDQRIYQHWMILKARPLKNSCGFYNQNLRSLLHVLVYRLYLTGALAPN